MQKLKTAIYTLVLVLMGGAGAAFSVCYFAEIDTGFVAKFHTALTIAAVLLFVVLTVLSVVFYYKKSGLLQRLSSATLFLLALAAALFYLAAHFHLLERFRSIEDLRRYIAGKGRFAAIVFIFIQFAQVVFLPIPSVVTTGAGVACFGLWKGALYSFIGIWLGSLVAFFVGRKLGYRAAAWVVGKDSLDVWLEKIRGKDKLLLTFMFVMPFFPDDLLCFVAGLSTMTDRYFVVMITLVRMLTVFVSCVVLNGNIIPFNTPLGLTIWAILFIIVLVLTVVCYKKGTSISDKLLSFFSRKGRKNDGK